MRLAVELNPPEVRVGLPYRGRAVKMRLYSHGAIGEYNFDGMVPQQHDAERLDVRVEVEHVLIGPLAARNATSSGETNFAVPHAAQSTMLEERCGDVPEDRCVEVFNFTI